MAVRERCEPRLQKSPGIGMQGILKNLTHRTFFHQVPCVHDKDTVHSMHEDARMVRD